MNWYLNKRKRKLRRWLNKSTNFRRNVVRKLKFVELSYLYAMWASPHYFNDYWDFLYNKYRYILRKQKKSN